jgi:hypothetical protein
MGARHAIQNSGAGAVVDRVQFGIGRARVDGGLLTF